MKYCFLLFLPLVFSQCKSDTQHLKQSESIVSITDSLEVFPSETYMRHLLFSPLEDDGSVLWTVGDSPQELNLIKGEWEAFSDLYDPCLRQKLSNKYIWKDTVTKEVFISCFHDRFIRIDPDTKLVTIYPIKPVVSLLTGKSRLLFGTANGLYQLDMATDSITIIDKVSTEEWVRELKKVDDNLLSYGKKDIITIKGDFKDINNYLVNYGRVPLNYNYYGSEDEIFDTGILPTVANGAWYVYVDDLPSTKWYLNANSLVVKRGDEIFKVLNLPEGRTRDLELDKVHLYVLYDKKLVVINRNHIELEKLSHLDAFVTVSDLESELNSLFNNEMSSDRFLKSYSRWDSLTRLSKQYGSLRKRFETSVQNLAYYWPDSFMDTLYIAERLPNELIAFYLTGKCRNALGQENFIEYKAFRKALLDSEKSLQLQQSENNKYDLSTMGEIDKVIAKLDSLDNMEMPGDEKRMAEYELKYEMVKKGWFESEGSIIITDIPDRVLGKLIQEYPKSYLRPKAEYLLLENKFAGIGEGGMDYLQDAVDAYTAYLQRHPYDHEANLARLFLCAQHFGFYDHKNNKEKEFKMYKKGLEFLENIDTAQVIGAKEKYDISKQVDFFHKTYLERGMRLSLEMEENAIETGSDLLLRFRIENLTHEPMQIKKYAKGFPFIMDIKPEAQIDFLIANEQDLSLETITINPGEVLSYDLVPTSSAVRQNYSTENGYNIQSGNYVLAHPGLVYARVILPESKYGTKQLSFYIK